MTTYQVLQARREIGMLRDLQKHIPDVQKRILIEQRIRKLEKELQQNEKNRPARRSSLRSRLKVLISFILPQRAAGVKNYK